MNHVRLLSRLTWLVLALMLRTASAQSTTLNGSYGFLINAIVSQGSMDGGSAVLGVLNFDGAGNMAGTYTFEVGDSADQPAGLNLSGALTGTYTTNADRTGTLNVILDLGLSFTFGIVITDGGKGVQLAATGCTDPCDIRGVVITGVARAASTSPLKGSYGYQLSILPNASVSIGAMNFDGAGNVSGTLTFVGVSRDDPHQPPVFTGNLSGTYLLNPDGSGAITLPPTDQSNQQNYSFVAVDGGSGLLVLQTGRRGNGVQFGSARLF